MENRFNCPHCKTKMVTYKEESCEIHDWSVKKEDDTSDHFRVSHFLLRCNGCDDITYIKRVSSTIMHYQSRPTENELISLMQYPAERDFLPEYINGNIRKFYLEAVEAYNFGLLNSASAMCRRTIYEICDKKKVAGKDYGEKIKNLGLDKRITDPLLNIKNIGDDSLHATGWNADTVKKAIDALGLIIDLMYVAEEKIKDFSKHYTKENKARKIEQEVKDKSE
ncbi:MAG: DUF4145 domain-containing protein [Candidatus Moranbacteria bacterium]|nr:DUF4145 domain-containing protein [Candidatus Moranbacteria bacterium]